MGKFYAETGAALTLYVRQLAWLNTAPKPKSRALDGARPDSRGKAMAAKGMALPLPPCPAPFLIEHLMELGPVVAAGMGAAPIGWSDIVAWQGVTGIALPPWQARLIRQLSCDYLAMCREAEAPECPAPWQSGAMIESNRDTVSRRLGDALRRMSRRKRTR